MRGDWMPRARDPNRDKAFDIYKASKGEIDLVEIASQLNVPPGTVRGWKSKDKWDANLNGTLQIDTERSQKRKKAKKKLEKAMDDLSENNQLTEQEKMYCLHFVNSFNQTKSYQKAYGCSYTSAMASASRLMAAPKIQEEINRLKRLKYTIAYLDPQDIFQKYMDIAFSDISDYLSWGREVVPVMGAFGPIEIKNEDGEKEKVMQEINTVRLKESCQVDGTLISEVKQSRDGVSIKLLSKEKALQWLTDHMHMATEEQAARIAVLKAKAQLDDTGETEDDGFIDALKGKVDDIWSEE